jgi:hypothetical protein
MILIVQVPTKESHTKTNYSIEGDTLTKRFMILIVQVPTKEGQPFLNC